jgi:hypothetical protein
MCGIIWDKKYNASAINVLTVLFFRVFCPCRNKPTKETNMIINAKIIAAYKRTLEADNNDAEYSTSSTKRAATRAANALSRHIHAANPDMTVREKIALRTELMTSHS